MPMRPRIFSLMLTAFGLVIVLGVGGMLTVFWLVTQSAQRSPERWQARPEVFARAEARRLAQLYERNGSWANVESSFGPIERELRAANLQSVALLDAEGRVVASRTPRRTPPPAPGVPLPLLDGDGSTDGVTVRSVPIRLDGDQIGALVIVYRGAPGSQGGFATFARSVLSAGLALTAILLALAAFFSGRISKPLRQLDAAAHAMAAGNLQVRVQPGPVREVADLARSFNRMADTLEDADRQRRQLTADVAHELRTPLSIIKGRLEGIEDGVYRADPEQVAGLLDEVSLLERLIEDLRLLALADAGQLTLAPELVDPAGLLQDARRSFAQQAQERGVALQVAAGPALPELTADPQRIAQVLGNLVSNALRHTPAGGMVALAARAQPDGVLFEVRDSGVGIAPEDLPRIFDRFFRADSSRARASGGAGLGLAIARRIVEAHGGRIWATSAPGQGTAVHFILPCH